MNEVVGAASAAANIGGCCSLLAWACWFEGGAGWVSWG